MPHGGRVRELQTHILPKKQSIYGTSTKKTKNKVCIIKHITRGRRVGGIGLFFFSFLFLLFKEIYKTLRVKRKMETKREIKER